MKVGILTGFQFQRTHYWCGELCEAPPGVRGQLGEWEMLDAKPVEAGSVEVLWRCWVSLSPDLKAVAGEPLGKP